MLWGSEERKECQGAPTGSVSKLGEDHSQRWERETESPRPTMTEKGKREAQRHLCPPYTHPSWGARLELKQWKTPQFPQHSVTEQAMAPCFFFMASVLKLSVPPGQLFTPVQAPVKSSQSLSTTS